jgi:hypothetical protein
VRHLQEHSHIEWHEHNHNCGITCEKVIPTIVCGYLHNNSNWQQRTQHIKNKNNALQGLNELIDYLQHIYPPTLTTSSAQRNSENTMYTPWWHTQFQHRYNTWTTILKATIVPTQYVYNKWWHKIHYTSYAVNQGDGPWPFWSTQNHGHVSNEFIFI